MSQQASVRPALPARGSRSRPDERSRRSWPYTFTGGTIKRVAVEVSGGPYLDLEREAVAMLARE